MSATGGEDDENWANMTFDDERNAEMWDMQEICKSITPTTKLQREEGRETSSSDDVSSFPTIPSQSKTISSNNPCDTLISAFPVPGELWCHLFTSATWAMMTLKKTTNTQRSDFQTTTVQS